MTVVVAGASGALGRLAAQRLLADLEPGELVLVSRSPERLADLAAAGARVVRGGYGDPASLGAAFAGAERLLMVSAPAAGGAAPLPLHENAIHAAAAAGIGHIVYTSFANPAVDNPAFPSASNRATEQALLESGVPHTILRNAIYADLRIEMARRYLASGRFVTSSGDGRHAFIWRADCAQAAAQALLSADERSRTVELTGPELVSTARFAALLEEFGGHRLQVAEVGDEEFRAYSERIPLDPGEAHPPELHWTTGRAIREGHMSQLSDGFREITGREPRSLGRLFEVNRSHLRNDTS